MTISELAEVIRRANRQDRGATLILAAEAIYQVKLPDGRGIRDAMDARDYLIALSDEFSEIPKAQPKRTARDHTCLDCKHEHETREECKYYLGEGRFCPCESKVTA